MGIDKGIDKARFWTAVLYPENMEKDWEDKIGDTVQLPYAYCIHNRSRDSKSEHRKDHIHMILAFPNTTTYKHALEVFNLLSAEGKKAVNTCKAVVLIRNTYDYLIHDTENCRKQGKELYDKSERITGNGFDIGAYEQLGITEKNEIKTELRQIIMDKGFTNFGDVTLFVDENYEDTHYSTVLMENYGYFATLTKSNFQKWQVLQEYGLKDVTYTPKQHDSTSQAHAQAHENNTQAHENCCPYCGSVDIKKKGKTASLSQRWQCKDCGKTFTF